MENWYPFTQQTTGKENYLFVSDLHGLQVQDKIKVALEKYPDIRQIFFLGDVIGTDELAKLQRLFYNVFNPSKAALNQQPDIADNDLFNFKIDKECTIGNELTKLVEFLTTIGEYNFQLSGEQARQITNYVHYGHFVGNLSVKARNSLRQRLETNADNIIKFVYDIAKEHGILSHIVEGNWDARTPLDFCRGTECISISKEKRSFYFGNFIRNNEMYHKYISYSDKPNIIKDCLNRIIFVLWPFDAAVTPTMIPEINEEDWMIVLVSHTQVLWSPIKGETPMTIESRNIATNMPMTIDDIKADWIVHGHLHDRIEASGYYYTNTTGISIPVHYLPFGEIRAISF